MTTEYLGDVNRMRSDELVDFANRISELVSDHVGNGTSDYVEVVESIAREYDLENAEVAFAIRLAIDAGRLEIEHDDSSARLLRVLEDA